MPKQRRIPAGLFSRPGRFLLMVCLSCLLGLSPVLGQPQAPGAPSGTRSAGDQLIPIEQQPYLSPAPAGCG
ncbi:hypothetical protein SynMEDNS5_01580 [Synechococcus sp. MEDNS5]|uniref:hypothetical protein n=1 Tax=Synechococcus sp. MEDNS5 TaxID=1442554 RepID=UPI001647EA8D|nr:hypothetical protein [Synechococcus sp. MEDNS5]QNJ06299.1 hypothetical protein SynMEDNS5_01580 [Synechococcus sp. MEDNS5]